jgi:hypothetical protein
MRLSFLCFAVAVGIAGCNTQQIGALPAQSKADREAQILGASLAVKAGNFEQAEHMLAGYMYRDASGELRFKSLSVSGETEKQAVDTVALMLWDTKRDATLEKFANRYLSGYERDVMLCRLAERNAVYEKAYNCWNDLGDVDRARRTVRTESALRILKD